MDNVQWTIKVCAMRTYLNHFAKQNTFIFNCQLSIVNCPFIYCRSK